MITNKNFHGPCINHEEITVVQNRTAKNNKRKMSVILILIKTLLNLIQLNSKPVILINGDQIIILKIMILLINIVEE